jgi:hypothetical protein
MRTSSRTLLGFGIGLGILIVVTIILALTLGRGNSPLMAENTPQGIVQRYLLAVQEKNYSAAYNYLAPSDPKNVNGPIQSYDMWLQASQNSANSTWKANLGQVSISGETANVGITIEVLRPGGPFGNPVNTNNITFFLKKVGANWLIVSPADLYWLY